MSVLFQNICKNNVEQNVWNLKHLIFMSHARGWQDDFHLPWLNQQGVSLYQIQQQKLQWVSYTMILHTSQRQWYLVMSTAAAIEYVKSKNEYNQSINDSFVGSILSCCKHWLQFWNSMATRTLSTAWLWLLLVNLVKQTIFAIKLPRHICLWVHQRIKQQQCWKRSLNPKAVHQLMTDRVGRCFANTNRMVRDTGQNSESSKLTFRKKLIQQTVLETQLGFF